VLKLDGLDEEGLVGGVVWGLGVDGHLVREGQLAEDCVAEEG